MGNGMEMGNIYIAQVTITWGDGDKANSMVSG